MQKGEVDREGSGQKRADLEQKKGGSKEIFLTPDLGERKRELAVRGNRASDERLYLLAIQGE